MKGKNLTVRYAITQLSFWLVYTTVYAYQSVYLLQCGFSNTGVGIVSAVSGVFSAILQPALATYADRPKSLSLKKILEIMGGIGVLFGILLVLFGFSKVVVGVVFCGALSLVTIGTSMINSLGIESINNGAKLNFGIGRGMGSVGYGGTSFVLGIVTGALGGKCIPYILVGVALVFIGIVKMYPFKKRRIETYNCIDKSEDVEADLEKIRENEKTDSKKYSENSCESSEPVTKENDGAIAFLKRYPQFSFVLLGFSLIYISHVVCNNFLYQIVEGKGGDSTTMGVVIALASAMEIPAMLGFDWMKTKLQVRTLMKVAAAAFVLKMLATLLVPNMLGFYFVQLLQFAAWGLTSVAAVFYVNSIMKEQDAIKGQAYFMMTFSIATVLGALLGGAILDVAGLNAMLVMGLVFSAPGMLLVLKYA